MEDKNNTKKKTQKSKFLQFILILLLIGLLAFILFRLNLKRKLSLRKESIRAAGYPVSLEELNQWYSIPYDVENAAYVILDALDYYKEPEDKELLPVVGKAELPSRNEPMTEETLKIVSQFLSKNQYFLELLHKTADLEYGRFPAVDFTLGMGTRLPHINDMRNCTLLLILEAACAAENENPDIAVQAIKSILGVASSLNKEPATISQLVRIAYQGYAVSSLEYVMNRTAFTDEQLIELGKIFNKAQKQQGILTAIIGERCMYMNFLMQPRSDYFEPGSALFFPPLLFLYEVTGLSDSDTVVFLDLMDEYIRAIKLPAHKRLEKAKEIDAKINEIPKIHILLRIFIPAFGHFINNDLQNVTQLRTSQVALAVQRYRLNNNKLPDSLDTLAPDYIDEVPLDPFDGKQLRYKKLDPGFVIYSIGKDLSDDGGREMPEDSRQRGNSMWDITFTVER